MEARAPAPTHPRQASGLGGGLPQASTSSHAPLSASAKPSGAAGGVRPRSGSSRPLPGGKSVGGGGGGNNGGSSALSRPKKSEKDIVGEHYVRAPMCVISTGVYRC